MTIDPKATRRATPPRGGGAEAGGDTQSAVPFEVVVEEPGWKMFMVSHFHYDPVWWNTQAAYTETWKKAGQPWAADFQTHSFDLVKAHLDAARRDPDYAFVLAELDYLKPYWDTYPEDRAVHPRPPRRGTVGADRRHLQRTEYQPGCGREHRSQSDLRHRAISATCWEATRPRPGSLMPSVTIPQFPGLAADAGLTSSSWARGPFHAWGPFRMPIHPRPQPSPTGSPEPLRMEFPSEFYWVAPSGKKLLTSYMADHYSAGLVDGFRPHSGGGRGADLRVVSANSSRWRPPRTCCSRSAPTTALPTNG